MRRHLVVLADALRLMAPGDRRRALAVAALSLAGAATAAGTGISQRWLVDSAALGDAAGVAAAVGVGVLAHGLAAAGGRIQSNLRFFLVERLDLRINQKVLGSVMAIPTVKHLENPRYLDRLCLLRNGVWALAAAAWAVVDTVAAAASLLATVWLLAGVHPAVAALAGLGVPPLLAGWYGQGVVQRAEDRAAEALRHERRLHDLTVAPGPAKEILVSGAGPAVSRDADAAWRTAWRLEARARAVASAWQVAGWVCYAAGLVGALVLTGRQVAAGAATAGDMVLVVSLGGQLLGQIGQAVAGVNQLAEAGHVTDHYRWLQSVAGRPGGRRPAPGRLRHGIDVRGVRFRYASAGRDVLTGIDLHLPAGCTVALVGANGTGKSTLVKLLVGLYEPTGGRIEVDGTPLASIDPVSWRGRLTGAFQDAVRFQVRARDAVGVGDLSRGGDTGDIMRAVRRAGATDVTERLPQGLQTRLGVAYGGVDLSAGQWQKIALARGQMRPEPLLLVLDEPSAALDPSAEHDLFARYAAQARRVAGRTGAVTLLVSHRFSTVRMADLVVVLDDGRVAECGSHDELLAAGGQYARMYHLQARGYRQMSHG